MTNGVLIAEAEGTHRHHPYGLQYCEVFVGMEVTADNHYVNFHYGSDCGDPHCDTEDNFSVRWDLILAKAPQDYLDKEIERRNRG